MSVILPYLIKTNPKYILKYPAYKAQSLVVVYLPACLLSLWVNTAISGVLVESEHQCLVCPLNCEVGEEVEHGMDYGRMDWGPADRGMNCPHTKCRMTFEDIAI